MHDEQRESGESGPRHREQRSTRDSHHRADHGHARRGEPQPLRRARADHAERAEEIDVRQLFDLVGLEREPVTDRMRSSVSTTSEGREMSREITLSLPRASTKGS